MLVGRVDDVLVYLVGNAVGVVLFAEVGDKGELLARKDLAAGVGRVAQDDALGSLSRKAASSVSRSKSNAGWLSGT